MRRLRRIMLAVGAGAAAGVGIADAAMAEQKEVIVGQMCDRTGPTQINGVVLCPASHDYYNLINSKGGIEGYQIKSEELDHEYKVPQAVEAYQRMKGDGAVSIMAYGTPQVQALNQNFAEGAGAIQFIKDKLGGSLEGKKIAYVFYDNPAGREPIPVIEDLQKLEKFELRTFAVPPPGVELGAQVLDITQRYRPDFVIAHLFGRSPAVAIKEFKRNGFPLSKMMGLVWASAEADILAAGGFPVAEGYH